MRTEPHLSRRAHERTTRSLPQNALRIYLVEDSPVIRERIIEHVVEQDGGEIIGCAETEDDAVQAILELKPDAVVLDIQLRAGNGFNVLRRLRVLPVDTKPAVIVFSNHADAGSRKRAAGEGARYFLDKASEFNHLAVLLHRLGMQSVASH